MKKDRDNKLIYEALMDGADHDSADVANAVDKGRTVIVTLQGGRKGEIVDISDDFQNDGRILVRVDTVGHGPKDKEFNWTDVIDHRIKGSAADVAPWAKPMKENLDSATPSAAIADAVDALKHNDFEIKDADLNAGTVTIHTGKWTFTFLKYFDEGHSHGKPVSQRPDKPTRLRHDVKPRVSADDFGDESEFDQKQI